MATGPVVALVSGVSFSYLMTQRKTHKGTCSTFEITDCNSSSER